MSIKMNSFHITDVIYDANEEHLTYNFLIGNDEAQRTCCGVVTSDDIANDFKRVIEMYFAAESE